MMNNTIGRLHRTWLLAPVCLLAWVAVPSGSVVTADDLCGATILTSIKLDHDLTCVGPGLIVGADGIKVNLNGHTITGSSTAVGSGFGISVIGRRHVSITGGTVTSFEAGVRVMNSTDIVIKDNEFRANNDGVDLAAGSAGNTVKENEFVNNLARGIMLRGAGPDNLFPVTDNLIKENSFTGNRVGVLLFAGVDNTVKENRFTSHSLAGIRVNVPATGNLVIENTIEFNPAGIEFLVATMGPMAPAGNTFVENRIANNVCGLKGPSDGNAFDQNVFEANAVDSCQ